MAVQDLPPYLPERKAWHEPGHKGQSDPTRRVNSHMSDSGVRGLTPQRVLWYFAVQSNRPFEIPIQKVDLGSDELKGYLDLYLQRPAFNARPFAQVYKSS